MQAFWEQRYAEPDYAYGKEPNAFFRQYLDHSNPSAGALLLPAEGEGRNAVYAATKGWEALAFDYSAQGKAKALALAEEKAVTIQYTVCAIQDFPFPTGKFDLVGLFFVHLPPPLRLHLHQATMQALKPGGTVILEAFSADQLGFFSGGPKDPAMLYEPETLQKDFLGLDFIHLEKIHTELREGPYHSGPASVTRFIGKKPE